MALKILKWSAVLMVLFVSFAANADDKRNKTEKTAKELYLEGKAHFEKEQYDEALESFTKSYNLSVEPSLLYNLGLTAELAGDLERAIAYYEVFLEELPDSPDAAEVRVHVAELKENKDKPVPDEGIDEEFPQGEEVAEPLPPMPELVPVVEEKYYESEQPEEESGEVFWPGVAFGVGGLFLASGTITGIAAYQKYQNLEATCSPVCSSEKVKTSKNLALATDIQLAVGAAAVITGLIMWIAKPGKEKNSVSGSLSAVPAPVTGGGALMIQGRF